MKKLILGAVLMLASFVVSAASVSITPVSGAIQLSAGDYYQAGNTSTFQLELNGIDTGIASVGFTASLSDWSYSLFEGTDTSGTPAFSAGTFVANSAQGFSLTMVSSVIYSLVLSGDVGTSFGFLTTFNVPIEVSEVPLPAAVWLFGSVLLGGLAMRRRSQKMNVQAVAA
ncbi:hypothetical protein [Nitrincola schmidtii]|uniref:hypothetical protein n=1 Tax=Nitrincola schmidtii TaxID=1730894 RepID=UPI00124D5DEE|nr:hypothetical protein [Nitrincola schmidtii]